MRERRICADDDDCEHVAEKEWRLQMLVCEGERALNKMGSRSWTLVNSKGDGKKGGYVKGKGRLRNRGWILEGSRSTDPNESCRRVVVNR